ncbi:hypothetical protein BDW74DRAFT_183646 [Aspergillus multicolor]|uniref:uncharacterized protein n=1 Tax=Aspergillus multicolor TaxID=41759 RepID=UPI003CCE4629
MSGLRYRAGVLPAADAARILNAARVPNLLFGWWAINLYSLSQRFPEIDFLETAIRALIDNGFTYCGDAQCVELKDLRYFKYLEPDIPHLLTEFVPLLAYNNIHELADAHFHIETQYTCSKFTVLSLHK